MNTLELLGLIVVWALLDSIDPCFYAILATILLSAMLVSHRYAVRAGLVFILAIFMGYLIVGLLFRYVALVAPKPVLIVALLVYGLVVLVTNISKYIARRRTSRQANLDNGLVCREDDVPCRLMRLLNVNTFVTSGLIWMYVLGLLSSFTILPCSAQLYLLFHIVTRDYGFLAWILLTIFYVAIFISPAVLVYLMFIMVSRRRWFVDSMIKHELLFKITGSLLMIGVAIYLAVNYYLHGA